MITNEKQYLAYELVKELGNDKKHFGFYCILIERYSPIFLWGILNDLKELKNWPKVKNKGAYFTALFFKKIKSSKALDKI
jgi:hypothetical protein